MKQDIHYYLEGSPYQRPKSNCTVYVDGTAGDQFRKGVDIELSHWRPNQTEEKYKAGTSTEICFKFLALNKDAPYDLVINNHLDIDGLLSVFTLTHPSIALSHKDILIKAAEAGDFWAWANGKALILFQNLSQLFGELRTSKLNLTESYQRCFEVVLKILQGQNSMTKAAQILDQQDALVRNGMIIREELNTRLVSYHVPKEISKDKEQHYLKTAHFNEPLSNRLAFWPQVRNRLDPQKMHLVSIETNEGTHYDLWFPMYCWADTKGLWYPPGLMPPENTINAHTLQWDSLSKVVAQLNSHEQGACYWTLFSGLDFSNRTNPRNFPIVASTLTQQGHKKESWLPVEMVKNSFRSLGI
jgi:hypothetical protein